MKTKKITTIITIFLVATLASINLVSLVSAQSFFEDLYFETCLDASCENPGIFFTLSQSPIYIKVRNNTEGARVSAILTLPDNSTQPITFSGDTATVYLTQLGEYEAEVISSKSDYYDQTDIVWFSVVEEPPSFDINFFNINFKTCSDTDCQNPGTLFPLSKSKIYLKAFNSEDAYLSGKLLLPDNSVREIFFNNDIAIIKIPQQGKYYASITASKQGYSTDNSYVEFEVTENLPQFFDLSNVCNFNSACELGEDYQNCPSDCSTVPTIKLWDVISKTFSWLNNEETNMHQLLLYIKDYAAQYECTDTCETLGYECGTQTICNQQVECGTCSAGFTCSAGNCVQEQCTPTQEDCVDGIDNDCDSLVDCQDSDCFTHPACQQCTPTPEDCTNLIDDDCDLLVDCADTDCYSNQACAVPDLISHYKFENNAQDSAGTYHGTLAGDTNFQTGKSGLAANFDGSGNYIQASGANFNTNSYKTIALWVKPTRIDNYDRIITKNKKSSSLGFIIAYNTGYSLFGIANDGTEMRCQFGAVPAGNWYHLALVYDEPAGKVSCYTNGAFVSSTATVPGWGFASNDNLEIGGRTGVAQWFGGLIDELRIYNKALTASEIQALYNADACTPQLESCTNLIDDDCDLLVDCADDDCNSDPACQTCIPSPEICNDGIDNDCDGLIDNTDPDCAQETYCGDSVCNADETCQTCAIDCGECATSSLYKQAVQAIQSDAQDKLNKIQNWLA